MVRPSTVKADTPDVTARMSRSEIGVASERRGRARSHAADVLVGVPVCSPPRRLRLPVSKAAVLLMSACEADGSLVVVGHRRALTHAQVVERKAQIKAALAEGVDINGLYRRANYTFLTRACSAGLLAIVKALLELGADPNLMDPNGARPIHVARSRGHDDVAELLLERGADPCLTVSLPGCVLQ